MSLCQAYIIFHVVFLKENLLDPFIHLNIRLILSFSFILNVKSGFSFQSRQTSMIPSTYLKRKITSNYNPFTSAVMPLPMTPTS